MFCPISVISKTLSNDRSTFNRGTHLIMAEKISDSKILSTFYSHEAH